MILAPLAADADMMRRFAGVMRWRAEQYAATSRVLASLRYARHGWESEAGALFLERVTAFPATLDLVVDRYAVVASAIESLAQAAAEESPRIQWCVEEDRDAQAHIEACERELEAVLAAGASLESVAAAAILARQRHHVERQQQAREAHRAAWLRYEEADARCATHLRIATQDNLTDTHVYRAVRTAQEVGHALASLGLLARAHPALAGLAVVGAAVGTLADITMLVGYDEGSLSEVGTNIALTAAGAMGSTMKAGALARGSMSGGRVSADASLSIQQRLALGRAHVWGGVMTDLKGLHSLAPGATAARAATAAGAATVAPRAGAVAAGQGARFKVGAALTAARNAAYRNDLLIATAGGREARNLYLTSQGLKVGGMAINQSASLAQKRGDVSSTACRSPGTPSPRRS